MSEIDQTTLARLSKLAQIELPEQKSAKLAKDLTSILDFIDQLSEANTDDVVPLRSTLELTQNTVNTRDDIITHTNEREAIQAIAPEVEDVCIRAGSYRIK